MPIRSFHSTRWSRRVEIELQGKFPLAYVEVALDLGVFDPGLPYEPPASQGYSDAGPRDCPRLPLPPASLYVNHVRGHAEHDAGLLAGNQRDRLGDREVAGLAGRTGDDVDGVDGTGCCASGGAGS
jgi:hypothetical protein